MRFMHNSERTQTERASDCVFRDRERRDKNGAKHRESQAPSRSFKADIE